MAFVARTLTLPDQAHFKQLLDGVGLVPRARIMQQLQDVVFLSAAGFSRQYFCMDGEQSPLHIAAELFRRSKVMPCGAMYDFFQRELAEIILSPLSVREIKSPSGFVKECDVLSYRKTPVAQTEQVKCAHQVCAYLLLNNDAAVEFDLGSATAYNGANGRVGLVRKKDGILFEYVNGLHERKSVVGMSDMSDYRGLFNIVVMALFETTC